MWLFLVLRGYDIHLRVSVDGTPMANPSGAGLVEHERGSLPTTLTQCFRGATYSRPFGNRAPVIVDLFPCGTKSRLDYSGRRIEYLFSPGRSPVNPEQPRQRNNYLAMLGSACAGGDMAELQVAVRRRQEHCPPTSA